MTSRKTGSIALMLSLALGLFASTASAEPLAMQFAEDRANVGVQLSDTALFEPPEKAPFDAQIDPATGAITAGALQVPEFSTFITDPVSADVAVDFEIGVITGSFDQATGALTLSGKAGGMLTADGDECVVSTTPVTLTLSTAGSSGGSSPRSGEPFTAGLRGAGAIAGQWTDMHALPVAPDDATVCNTVDTRIGGPGGIWMKQDDLGPLPPTPPTPPRKPDVGPPPPPPAACIVPKLPGKTPARAKAALRAANCKLGKVGKPKGMGSNLVVKSSTPAAGATPANGTVHLKLGPKHRKAHS